MTASASCRHCGFPVRSRGAAAAYCCLGCRIAHQVAGAGGDEGAARWVHARFLLAALFGVAVMMFSMILYSEELFDSGLEGSAIGQLLRWALLALSAPVLLLLAPALVDASQSPWRRLLSLDLWILLAVGAAWALSAWRVWQGRGALYFESAAMVLILVTLGRYLEARARVRVGEAAAQLRKLLPERTQLLGPAGAREVAVASVAAGETVRAVAGERVPLDGVVLAGCAAADFSLLNGEHAPRSLSAGDSAPAGVLLLDGALDLRVTAAAGRRQVDRIAESLAQARSQRSPAQRAADRLAAWLLPAALLLALAVWLDQSRRGDFGEGTVRALSVLLVSCPCSLGLATPLATWSAIGAALRAGILIRNVQIFEILPRVRSFLFDKTGTLTSGSLHYAGLHAAAGEDPAALREVAATFAACSQHPAARALRLAQSCPIPESFQVSPGRGVHGRWQGRDWWLGSRRFLADGGLAIPAELERAWDAAEERGQSVLALARRDGGARALFLLEEQPRPEAAQVIRALEEAGGTVRVLSGDRHGAASRLRERLGVEVAAELLPEDKLEQVARAGHGRGPVAFVGDGSNDAPALARADVSVAVAGGSDVARAAADAVFLRDDLRLLLELRSLAQAARRRIRFNLAWSVFYNPLFLYLAASGRLSPIPCALAMAASSLLVTALSARDPLQAPAAPPPHAAPAWTPSSKPAPSAS